MKKLLLALGLCFSLSSSALAQGPIVGPGQPILCVTAAQMAVGPSSITRIITGATGKAINICGWHITNTGASGTFSFQIGTGTNCGTNTATVVPAMSISNTAPVTDHIDYAFLTVPTATDLCVTPSVATIAVVVYYNQF
jgi:hypothetical protein